MTKNIFTIVFLIFSISNTVMAHEKHLKPENNGELIEFAIAQVEFKEENGQIKAWVTKHGEKFNNRDIQIEIKNKIDNKKLKFEYVNDNLWETNGKIPKFSIFKYKEKNKIEIIVEKNAQG